MARALKACSTCGKATSQGRCTECTRAADRARGTASERGYRSAGHRRFRHEVLERDPICVLCGVAWSTVADHYPLSRKDLMARGLDPNDPDRGRGLCKPCHDRSTAVHQPGGWAAPTTPRG